MPSLFRPEDRPLLHLALLLLTGITTLTAYYWVFSDQAMAVQGRLLDSAIFAASVLLILGAHEMGHYVLARLHRVETSLPYFIPVPLLGFGTLGAVIRIRGRIPDRNALVDIGAAGPLVGVFFALPIVAWGVAHSQLGEAPILPPSIPGPNSLWAIGREVLRHLWAWQQGAEAAPLGGQPQVIFGDNLLILGLQRALWGVLPPGRQLMAHPALVAGWFGLLVTMLNLMPIGQLDGGHLTHALFGPRAVWVGKLAALVMAGLCVFASMSWVVWLLVTTQAVGFRHPPVLLPEEPLSRGRKWVCALSFVVLALCAMPLPLSTVRVP